MSLGTKIEKTENLKEHLSRNLEAIKKCKKHINILTHTYSVKMSNNKNI